MRLERGRRASLALTLNFVAFAFAVSAVTTSYWCKGTRKVVKPFCSGPSLQVKQWFCIRFNSSDLNDSRMVQYIWETGEEKFIMRRFHTGIFFSCEQAADMNGLCGMVAHMMFTTIFQLAVAMGPEDWRPKSWDYSWSYALAWSLFGTCMGSAVTALNRYTKTIVEFKHKRRSIEKSLRVQCKLLPLDLPERMWDAYPTPGRGPGHKPASSEAVVARQGEVY